MVNSKSLLFTCLIFCLMAAPLLSRSVVEGAELPAIQVSTDGTHFVSGDSGTPFRPMGFNYDHDADGRLLEDYWHSEWDRVENDFRDMQSLGANVVRIHLQFGKFMKSAT